MRPIASQITKTGRALVQRRKRPPMQPRAPYTLNERQRREIVRRCILNGVSFPNQG